MTDTILWSPNITMPIDPDAQLGYTWDWSRWLPEHAQITSHVIETEGDVQVIASAHESKRVTVWIANVTAGQTATVTCRVTADTDPPLIDDRSVQFKGLER